MPPNEALLIAILTCRADAGSVITYRTIQSGNEEGSRHFLRPTDELSLSNNTSNQGHRSLPGHLPPRPAGGPARHGCRIGAADENPGLSNDLLIPLRATRSAQLRSAVLGHMYDFGAAGVPQTATQLE
jgi:hypothetical protein